MNFLQTQTKKAAQLQADWEFSTSSCQHVRVMALATKIIHTHSDVITVCTIYAFKL